MIVDEVLSCDLKINDSLNLDIYLDNSVFEVYINDGKIAMHSFVFLIDDDLSFSISSNYELFVEYLNIYSMNSIV